MSDTESSPPEIRRLDSALPARGLARSRTHAATLISAGLVTVDGRPVVKASHPVRDTQLVEVAANDHYVSRGAHKLVAALDAFDIAVTNRLALDAGASTGGFTQVLLERGARKVLAVDVGHGQLAEPVASDPRVVSIEGLNVRSVTAESLAALSGETERPSLVVADLSFISLGIVMAALRETATADADFVLLVKPQFEVGRQGIREGLVTSAALRADAVIGVLWSAWDLGLTTRGVVASPIAGGHGNREYLVWISATDGGNPTEWSERITAMTGE